MSEQVVGADSRRPSAVCIRRRSRAEMPSNDDLGPRSLRLPGHARIGHAPGRPAPVAIREIADRHGVPGPFLVQILRTLRTAGWVQSVRGSQGGYRLSVDPAKITLLDIAEAVGCQEAGMSHGGQSERRGRDAAGMLGRGSRSVARRAGSSTAQ